MEAWYTQEYWKQLLVELMGADGSRMKDVADELTFLTTGGKTDDGSKAYATAE